MKAKLSKKKTRKPRENSFIEKLVEIGDSRVVCLPTALIKRAGLTNRVTISFRDDEIIIRPAPDEDPRAGWEEQMKKAVAEHGSELTEEDREWLDAPLDTEFDEKEWTW